jgi:AraC family transcriptional regulator of adaptative response / DNA-3-methyladenine glycosylase II
MILATEHYKPAIPVSMVVSLQQYARLASSVAPFVRLQTDPRLVRAIAALPGLRIPGAWDTFELAVRAILGQQISVAAATLLANRLVETYGEPLVVEGSPDLVPELRFVFPTADVLAKADLTQLGIPRARAHAIAVLAATVAGDRHYLNRFQDLDDAVRQLCQLPGIGEWTAHYIAMRALREPDAFPATDLGLLRAMERIEQPLSKAKLLDIAQAWRPWRAYAAMYLWSLDSTVVLTTERCA